VVCYERTSHTERRAQWYRTAYRRLVMKLIDAMAVNGRLCREYTESLGMPSNRITTGQMVADTNGLVQQLARVTNDDKKQLRNRLGVSGLVFLFVGRLIELKGLRQLINAWAEVEKSHPGQATLVIVGSGPEKEHLKAQCAELKLSGVRFPGKVDYDAIAPYYAASDVFVIPTLEDNWSLVVPEAMACGLPILCSQYNGCYPELVKDGGNGWVFDPLNEESIAQALKNCLENQEWLPAMGQQSKVIVTGHTPTHAAEAIFQACHLAVTRRSH
jgi:glycosyltransferase involved in cell wall biosynthesis